MTGSGGLLSSDVIAGPSVVVPIKPCEAAGERFETGSAITVGAAGGDAPVTVSSSRNKVPRSTGLPAFTNLNLQDPSLSWRYGLYVVPPVLAASTVTHVKLQDNLLVPYLVRRVETVLAAAVAGQDAKLTYDIPHITHERWIPEWPGPVNKPLPEVLLLREAPLERSWKPIVVVTGLIVTGIMLGLTFMLHRQRQDNQALVAKVAALSAQLVKQRESLGDRIARALAPEAGAAPVGISTKDDRIYLAFNSDEGFASGRADLTPMLARQLDRLATVLADTRGKVTVLGHTDDAPGPRDRMESNLALSTARATAVGRHLQESGITSDRLSIIGRGVKDPVGDNRTAAGRALNRRVEIVLESVPNPQPTGPQR